MIHIRIHLRNLKFSLVQSLLLVLVQGNVNVAGEQNPLTSQEELSANASLGEKVLCVGIHGITPGNNDGCELRYLHEIFKFFLFGVKIAHVDHCQL